jgi:8-oxo-dGTP diphosphatase
MIDVSCAVILKKKDILAMRRGPKMRHAGGWEFPGGKIKAGETPRTSLVREIQEELIIPINIVTPIKSVEWVYPDLSIRLHPFLCKTSAQNPTLTEHDQFRWLSVDDLFDVPWLDADLPIVSEVEKRLRAGKFW